MRVSNEKKVKEIGKQMKREKLEDISDINRLKVRCIMVFSVEGVGLKESSQTQ